MMTREKRTLGLTFLALLGACVSANDGPPGEGPRPDENPHAESFSTSGSSSSGGSGSGGSSRASPGSNQCCNYNWGGTSGVHYYTCCNVPGLPTNITYQNASCGNYCGDNGSGGTTGNGTQTSCYAVADPKIVGACNAQCGTGRSLLCQLPGGCWTFTGCFKKCTQRLAAAAGGSATGTSSSATDDSSYACSSDDVTPLGTGDVCPGDGGAGAVCPIDAGAGDGDVGGCFAAGTPITMADGTTKPIETIRAGDTVLTYDPEAKVTATGRVERTFVHANRAPLIRVHGALLATANHPFYTRGEWIPAGELSMDDTVLELDVARPRAASVGSTPHAIRVSSLQTVPPADTVYNIQVATYHDYFAAGVLVHNKATMVSPDSAY
jgi:hypothetical protein